MGKRCVSCWVNQPKVNQILISFSVPKTPKQVEKELDIKKIKLKAFLEKNLLRCLNPKARKSRFYIMTNKSRGLLKLSCIKKEGKKDWDLIGWIMASPRQRFIVLNSVDSKKRTSEEIRERSSGINSNLSRISTKGILKELVGKGLIETEMIERKRYYWICEKGKLILNDMDWAVDSV